MITVEVKMFLQKGNFILHFEIMLFFLKEDTTYYIRNIYRLFKN